jgi:hypothetical protein
VYCGNVEIIAISGIYKVFVGVYFASEGQITEPLTVMVQDVAVTKMSLLFNDGSDNGHYDEVFPVGKKKKEEK